MGYGDCTMRKKSWTHPICYSCWDERNPDRMATRLTDAGKEQCCHCGEKTGSGIYIRANPNEVPYPAEEEEDG